DRQRDPEQVPGVQRLPGRLGAVVHADGDHAGVHRRLRQAAGHRGSDDGLMADSSNFAGTATEATATGAAPAEQVAPARPPSKFWRKVRWHALNVFAGLVLLYLFIPISVIILFSFNDPAGKFNLTWHKFSLDAWEHPFGAPGIESAVKLSIEI